MCKDLLEIGESYGLEEDDIVSRGMGQAGVDVVFSPLALKLFKLCIEVKNVEKLNVVTTFLKHYNAYAARPKWDHTIKILVHGKNHTDPMVTLKMENFLELLRYKLVKD